MVLCKKINFCLAFVWCLLFTLVKCSIMGDCKGFVWCLLFTLVKCSITGIVRETATSKMFTTFLFFLFLFCCCYDYYHYCSTGGTCKNTYFRVVMLQLGHVCIWRYCWGWGLSCGLPLDSLTVTDRLAMYTVICFWGLGKTLMSVVTVPFNSSLECSCQLLV